MSESLQDQIKRLERELAVKNAYLSVQFSFPKMSKLPQEVKEQVMEELKKACTQLAEDKESNVLKTPQASELTKDDVKILKDLITTLKNKTTGGTVVGKTTFTNPNPQTLPKEDPSIPKVDNANSVLKAIILTLENVPKELRSKVDSNSTVYVKKSENGRSLVMTQKGATFHIPTDDLEFESQPN